MRRTLALFLLITTSCAAAPLRRDESKIEEERRYRKASLLHSFGAPLVISGVSALLGAGILFGLGAGQPEDQRGSFSTTGGVLLAAGLLQAVVGAFLISGGSDLWVIEDDGRTRAHREPSPSEPDTQWTTTSSATYDTKKFWR